MTRFVALLCLAATGLFAADSAGPATAVKSPDYVRFIENESAANLQTAVAHFRDKKGVEVDLIGAVHIADLGYYQELNQRFKAYQAVLYELVGGPMPASGKRPAPVPNDGKSNLAWVGQLHAMMRDTLKLTGQLEGIDYAAKNFVHADMTMKEFDGAKEQKQESFAGLMLKAWMVQMQMTEADKTAAQPTLVKLLEILSKPDKADDLKRIIGREFDSMEALISGIEAGNGTVIIGERNRVALAQMDKQIAKGQRRIAVFYGAAHLVDMEAKLRARGFEKTQVEWLNAWQMKVEE
jgi:hypothetical protein